MSRDRGLGNLRVELALEVPARAHDRGVRGLAFRVAITRDPSPLHPKRAAKAACGAGASPQPECNEECAGKACAIGEARAQPGCGLPGERTVDLDGIVEVSETIAQIGREVRGRSAEVTASVSNFVPKPHTPYQWNGMQTREYFDWAGKYLRSLCRLRWVKVKQHDIERSMLEGLLTRGDRRTARVIQEAYRRGARLDAWTEYFRPELWWKVVEDLGYDFPFYVHRARPTSERLAWDHVNVKKGRGYLEKEQPNQSFRQPSVLYHCRSLQLRHQRWSGL